VTANATPTPHDLLLDQLIASMEHQLTNNHLCFRAGVEMAAELGRQQTGNVQKRDVQSRCQLEPPRHPFASTGDPANFTKASCSNATETTNVTKITSLSYRAYEAMTGSPPATYNAWTIVQTPNLRWIIIEQLDDGVVIDSLSVMSSTSAVSN
jgi:hypothetical protein